MDNFNDNHDYVKLTQSIMDRHYFGTISSLLLYDDFLLVGNGNILKILDYVNSKYIYSSQIFEQNKITRIKRFELNGIHIIFLIGESEIKYFITNKKQFQDINIHSIKNSTNDYIVDIYMVNNFLILGYINNFIDILDINIISDIIQNKSLPMLFFNFIKRQFCPEKCIVYSMNMIQGNNDDLIIASGTVFRNILIWKTNLSELNNNPRAIMNLKGHDGVVFNLHFADLKNLLSVSDDRTAKHWVLNYEDLTYEVSTFYGHSARIWDGKLDMKNNILVTVSEDCTGRLYDLKEKKLVKELVGAHLGKNIRCVEMNHKFIFTAGEDWQIVKWDITSYTNNIVHFVQGYDKDSKNSCFNESVISLSLPEDPNCIKAREKQKNFSPAVKILKIVHINDNEYVFTGTNHGEVLIYKGSSNTNENIEYYNNYILAYSDQKLRVVNSIDVIQSENNIILLIGLSDGWLAIVDINFINNFYSKISSNVSQVEIFHNIRLSYIYHKYLDSDKIILLFSTPLGTNKIFMIPVDKLFSVDEILIDIYKNNAATIITGSKYPLQICSAEVVSLKKTSGEFILFLGDFGGNLYFTKLKKIGHRFFSYSDVRYMKLHSDDKIGFMRYYADENLLYTAGRDGKIKKIFIQLIKNGYSTQVPSDGFTINEVDCKTRNDISSCEYLYKDKDNFFLVGHHGRDIFFIDYMKNTIFYSRDIKGCNRAFDIIFKKDGDIIYAYAENRITTLIKLNYNPSNTDRKVVNYNIPLHGKLIHSTLLNDIAEDLTLLVTASEDTKVNFYVFDKNNFADLKFIDQFTRHSGAVRSVHLIEKITENAELQNQVVSLIFCSVGASSETFVFKLKLYLCDHSLIKHSLFYLCDLTEKQENLDTRNMSCNSIQISLDKRKYLLVFTNTLGRCFTYIFNFAINEFKPQSFNSFSLKNLNFIPLCVKLFDSSEDSTKTDKNTYNLILGLTNGIVYISSINVGIENNSIELTDEYKQYKIHEAGINDIQLYGRNIFSCGEDNSIIISHMNSFDDVEILKKLHSFHSSPIKSINLTLHNRKLLLLSAGYDQNVNLLSIEVNNSEDKNEKKFQCGLITTIKACAAEINSSDLIKDYNDDNVITISVAGQGIELFKLKLS